MKTLIIDNYDSFTYNLVQYVGELGGNPVIFRNNEITLEEIKKLQPTHIIISPGPGDPNDQKYFGICSEIIGTYYTTAPLLGVCLGHQGIAAHFGAKVVPAPEVRHGKKSVICHTDTHLFNSIPTCFEAMRYHSLIVQKESLPDEIECIATTQDDDIVMAIKHKKYNTWGIQFHPESIGTTEGKKILANFLES